MPDEITFDGSDLQHLARDLREGARKVREETDVTLFKIETELTAEAKVLASAHSKTISGTIRMRQEPGAVIITAGDQAVPIAALYEKGNKGGKVTATTFRHPVFGGSVWVEQKRFPFLRPALLADRKSITRQLEATWDRALEPYRLKPRS